MLLVDEEMALREIVRGLPTCPVIVEIGTGLGHSTRAVLDERPDAVVFSIDVNVGGELPTKAVRLLGRSQDIGRFWPFEVDMVYVDGSHELDEVREDIRLWSEVVKRRGVIVLHDHSPPKPRKETARQLQHEKWVTMAANELLSDWEVIVHVNRLKAFRRD